MQTFYITFKEKQKFSKKELKKISNNFEIDTECNIIDFNNDGLSANLEHEHDQNRIEDVVKFFLKKNKIEINDFVFV